VGRKLSELSDEELTHFIRADARFQSKPPLSTGWFPPSCPDLSQYWFAKYELESRKPEAQHSPGASLHILATDPKEIIAAKVFEYGFRAASRKYHPDRGGDTAIMRALNDARQFARERLKLQEKRSRN
jgi:hypothetical protein